MLSRDGFNLSSSIVSFWNAPNSPEKNTLEKIKIACATLAAKIDTADDPQALATALSEWETELDTLSQSLSTTLNTQRNFFAQEIEKILSAEKGQRFHAKLSGHTHVKNRVLLTMKYGEAIQKLRGYDSRTGLLAIAIAALQTLLAAMLNETSWIYYLPAVIVVGSVLNHTAGMAIHEATHNLAAPTPLLNHLVRMMANLPIGIPHEANFARYHLDHHVYLGQPERDNDLPSPLLAQWVGNSSAKKALWLAFYPIAYAVTHKPASLNWKQVTNLLIQLTWCASVAYFLGPWALIYLLASTLVGFSALNPVSAHWIDEHFERDDDGQETRSYYGWLNMFNFNVGYHNEHHDFPDIPGSRLPELHDVAKDHYGKLHSSRSWLETSWRFISNPNVSAHDRIIRTANAQYHENAEALSQRTESERTDEACVSLAMSSC